MIPEQSAQDKLFNRVNYLLVKDFDYGGFSRPVRDADELEATRQIAISLIEELGVAEAKVAELEQDNGELVEQVAKVQDSYVKLDEDRNMVYRKLSLASFARDELQAKVAEQAAIIERLTGALEPFVDTEVCSLDHHGNCQTHNLGNPCEQIAARAVLKQEPK